MRIIHMSDIHFGNKHPTYTRKQIVNAVFELIKEMASDENTYFVISGDVTFQGRKEGYEQAKDFVNSVWVSQSGNRDRLVACPGNHDICEKSFKGFDEFYYAVSRESSRAFDEKSVILISRGEVVFLLINSAHHKDHTYGLVDLDDVDNILKDNHNVVTSAQHKVVVLHHHLIGVDSSDTSTIRNALPLLKLFDNYKFNLILHGHRHSTASFNVGSTGMSVLSTRSLNFPTTGLVNGISIYSFEDGLWKEDQYFLSNDNSLISTPSFKAQKG